jgi:hypothetical protein
MRQPSSPADRWEWWEAALAGREPPVHDGEPHAGFFKVRRFSYGKWVQGPFVPARIWWEPGETDPETGELLTPEICRAEIDGRRADPWSKWTWLARRPISETEYRWLTALSPLLPTKIPERKRAA